MAVYLITADGWEGGAALRSEQPRGATEVDDYQELSITYKSTCSNMDPEKMRIVVISYLQDQWSFFRCSNVSIKEQYLGSNQTSLIQMA